MSPHPCAGHDCDHCWICDGLGICCAQVQNLKAVLSAHDFETPKDYYDELKAAIAADVESANVQLSTRQLVALDAQAHMIWPQTFIPDPFTITTPKGQAALPPAEPKQLPPASNTPFLARVREDVKLRQER